MRILVTGANGYIGSKVVKELCDLGINVIATDLEVNNIDLRAKIIKANIFEDKDNWFSFFEEPDVCLHMAWRDGFIHNSKKHILDLPSHFSFITNLIDNGLKKIVSMGSMHEVGYWVGAVDEKTPCNPMSLYAVAKNALRNSIEIYAKEKKCIFMWLRAFYIYGDDDYGNSIFCKIRKAAAKGEKSFPFTKGTNEYDFINVVELAKQIAYSCIQNEIVGIVNCCTGNHISLAEQVENYIKKNDLSIKLDYGKFPDRAYDSPCIYGNSDKIKKIVLDFDLKKKRKEGDII